jgi:hypothetical protein
MLHYIPINEPEKSNLLSIELVLARRSCSFVLFFLMVRLSKIHLHCCYAKLVKESHIG